MLSTAGGEPVATQLLNDASGTDVLMPTAPLLPNTDYRVTYLEPCTDPSQPLQSVETVTSVDFRTTEAVPLPTSLGEIRVQKTFRQVTEEDSCGGALWTKNAAVVELTLHPAAELVPWLPLISLGAYVEDPSRSAGGANVGRLRARGDALMLGDITAYCDGTGREKPEVVTVVVGAKVAGAATQPAPVALDVDLRCEFDGGVGDAGVAAPSLMSDGGVAAAPSDDDGCSAGGAKRGSFGLGLPLLLLGALSRRRRGSCQRAPAT